MSIDLFFSPVWLENYYNNLSFLLFLYFSVGGEKELKETFEAFVD